MPRKIINLTERTADILAKMGKRIKNARLRRDISIKSISEQASVSEGTLYAIEKGSDSVSIGAYAAVLSVLGLDNDFDLVAKDEEDKKKFWEHNVRRRERATGKSKFL